MQLVRRERQQIDAEILHIDRDLADRLNRIGVKRDAMGVGDLCQFADRLQRTDDIVRHHHGDKPGLGPDRAVQRIG